MLVKNGKKSKTVSVTSTLSLEVELRLCSAKQICEGRHTFVEWITALLFIKSPPTLSPHLGSCPSMLLCRRRESAWHSHSCCFTERAACVHPVTPQLIDDDPFTFSLACRCIYSASDVVSFPLRILLMPLQYVKCGRSVGVRKAVWRFEVQS